MIVDDSAVARAVLSRMISQDPAFEIVDAVAGAAEAIARLDELADPLDVILLDLEMPGRSGISALPELIARSGGARVLIVSALADDGAAATVEALTLGAADTLAKPGTGSFGGQFSGILRERLLKLGRPEVLAPATVTQTAVVQRPAAPTSCFRAEHQPLACVAIGASTGGLHAIAALLRALPAKFDVPILITQHLPSVFMPFFADQMQALSGHKALVAREGMPIQPGRLHIAPGHAHLCVEDRDGRVAVRLLQHRSETGCLPSVDPMFAAAASVYGAGAVGVVLSGMGRDGTVGAEALAKAGADVFAQDTESSVIWGMPGSVAKRGLASAVLPPARIADILQRRWERA
ncbi:chemotaxis-specific protein-glutamate methyltransferase CheB [Sphingomonas colocasiae]|uniref:protein-glutamate methylesterase n=1 Tax=Sphingomonas colocasiae TaxID=1848973 RepID=A0ABS7PSB4_9SPHN|nr:chemotaxis-specific protein-glutamate methyltransferase CheB [Sphingomonas colocasiae]MBY8822884.1 chemotaxis-specific protein-glutamate methyltransferase CheB [Sphingomonas colocasiae]